MRSPLWLVALALGGCLWAQEPGLVQLEGLAPSERPAVLSSIRSLEEVLADWRLGAGEAAVKLGWTQYQLARFAAGRLEGLGYHCLLAQSGDAWWVLVRVTAGGAALWVPVVPGTPARLQSQGYQVGIYLGYVAWHSPGVFEEAYLNPQKVLPLPPNLPPQAVIRYSPSWPRPGQLVRFWGSLSLDPDGSIIRFWWELGDGETSSSMNLTHRYEREGTFRVTLTVVDEGGAQATATEVIRVYKPSSGDGCGCGG
ncbi:PKD domain-containing protein [Candidatus Bipolaricaulota bacterium]|nr:PKD domain-containing protein [Candidatus Bipolaricaulota bacterium]